MSKNIRALAISSGGILGCSVVGVVQALEQQGIMSNISHFSGSSVGAILAALLAAGATSQFLDRELFSIDMRTLKDCNWDPLRNLYRIYYEYGYCRGDVLQSLCRECMAKVTESKFDERMPDITFAELYARTGIHLIIAVTNLDKRCVEYWSYETRPTIAVSLAMRISASIPGIFRAIRVSSNPQQPLIDEYGATAGVVGKIGVREQSSEISTDLYVDGGCLASCPVGILRKYLPMDQILAVRYSSYKDMYPMKDIPVRSLTDFIDNLCNMYYYQAQFAQYDPVMSPYAIWIDTFDVSSLDFHIDAATKQQLRRSGYVAMLEYLSDATNENLKK